MPSIDIIDEVYVVADPAAVRAATCDGDRWRVWFPGLGLTPYDDRGPLGVRWRLSGALTGTAEVWLEAFGDGVIVHTYVRAEPADSLARPGSRGRRDRRSPARWGLAIKRHMTAVKDELEAGRAPGVARIPLAERTGPGDAPRVPAGIHAQQRSARRSARRSAPRPGAVARRARGRPGHA